MFRLRIRQIRAPAELTVAVTTVTVLRFQTLYKSRSGDTMRKIITFLAILLFLPTSLHAGTLNGVTMPDSAQVANATLVLNGQGLRTKYAFKVYVAGLYLPQKSSDPAAILKPDVPKRIVMHFVRSVGKGDITEGFAESFENHSPDTAKTLKPEIDRLFAAIDSVKDGDELVFSYQPGVGISFAMGGNEKLTISNPAFAEMLFSVWLGPKPPNSGLKKGLLGQ